MENVKTGILNKFKQSDESVKLAVAVGVGITAGVVATVAVQAYGRKREHDALQLQSHAPLQSAPRIFVRMPDLQSAK